MAVMEILSCLLVFVVVVVFVGLIMMTMVRGESTVYAKLPRSQVNSSRARSSVADGKA